VRVDLCHSLELERCDKGKIVFLEGDPGDRMYIILSGRVRLTISGQGHGRSSNAPLKILGPGEQFGELALLRKGTTGRVACSFA
jgi:CRP/FNR family cyclic AMP-dependent transcriptional regulator